MTVRPRPSSIRAEPASDNAAAYPASIPARPYIWRDRSRITAGRLIELEAHDRHIAGLEAAARDWRPPPVPGRAQQAERQARLRRFAGLLAIGLTVTEASAEIGVSRKTGHAYNRELRAAQSAEDMSCTG